MGSYQYDEALLGKQKKMVGKWNKKVGKLIKTVV